MFDGVMASLSAADKDSYFIKTLAPKYAAYIASVKGLCPYNHS